MSEVYYTCNLVPTGVIRSMGHHPIWLANRLVSGEAGSPGTSIHPMTCPYVTSLVAAAESAVAGQADGYLVVAGGCDAMRRLGDLLAAGSAGRVFQLAMPRGSDDRSVKTLAAELCRLERWLDDLPPGATDASDAASEEPPPLDYPAEPIPGGVFVIGGPLSNMSIPNLIADLGGVVSGVESCTSPDRWRPLAALRPDSDADPNRERLARKLLAIGMCPRRSTTERRNHLQSRFDETQASAIIYARQSFCDPGAYDAVLAAELAASRDLPFLEIEVGFPFDANGPLRTRVEAFLESQTLDAGLLGDDLFDNDLFGAVGAELDDLYDEEA